MRAGHDIADRGHGPRAFACYSPADPARVWSALTDPIQTTAFLYGLAVHSSWEPGAAIEVCYEARPTLSGRVLCSRTGERLSYMLRAGADDPPVYLTWLIRTRPDGCTIRLEIDEIDHVDDADQAEDTWLPVLAALQEHLAPA
ncbi:MAG TPA: SRPBCC domain-containing protein [Mycobacterium sp.]|jgi:uncharacterized protein YndB with AHSA1/START domain|nr:SRPBCC domain-containing protein [Mycobacterium sp.]